jgi:TolB-like protein/DNA-binding winged helix-turn-helix (wHTH) protein/tetratricopeptide (TPR) repeat protein
MDALVQDERRNFGDFRLEPRSGRLFRRNAAGAWVPVPIGSRAVEILRVLLDNSGAIVSRETIMDAVWPGITVAPGNLTVQIAALRRVLDEDRNGDSCIQTVSGRGYRLVLGVTQAASEASPDPLPARTPARPVRFAHHWRIGVAIGAATVTVLLLAIWQAGWFSPASAPHRLSLVVLPFVNLSGDAKDDYLADAVTDDLTTDLAHIRGAFVVAHQSAYAYKGSPKDVRRIGEELGVRYVLEGSVRRIGSILRVNAQLTSGETGAHLWSDRFDEPITELAAGQEQIVTRMRSELGISMIEIEKVRGQRERPTNPDAFDLTLRARSLQNLPPNPQRSREALALYEQALRLDPSSAAAMANIAYYLFDPTTTGLGIGFSDLQRAERLLKQARTIAPNSGEVLNYLVYWLSSMGRCDEVIEAAEQAIQMDPNQGTGLYNELGKCKTWTGHAEAEIPLQQTADRRNPLSSYKFRRYNRMGFASLMLGKDQDAITFYQRSLAMNLEEGGTHRVYRELAAAYARSGQMEDAKRALAEADRLWPYDTVRGHAPEILTSAVYVEQYRRYQDALRLAGERDHADEDADFGVPADDELHTEAAGRTATSAPGTTTIRTPELTQLLAEARPVVIDPVSNSWGLSIPGAVGLKFAGLGGSVTDEAQDRLRSKVHDLTVGDLNQPVVTVGWNSERFDGRNLALRLVALGYTRVYWYRGGREAWEVAGLPETGIDVQEW